MEYFLAIVKVIAITVIVYAIGVLFSEQLFPMLGCADRRLIGMLAGGVGALAGVDFISRARR